MRNGHKPNEPCLAKALALLGEDCSHMQPCSANLKKLLLSSRHADKGGPIEFSGVPEIDPILQRFNRKSSFRGSKVRAPPGATFRARPPPLAFSTFRPPSQSPIQSSHQGNALTL